MKILKYYIEFTNLKLTYLFSYICDVNTLKLLNVICCEIKMFVDDDKLTFSKL